MKDKTFTEYTGPTNIRNLSDAQSILKTLEKGSTQVIQEIEQIEADKKSDKTSILPLLIMPSPSGKISRLCSKSWVKSRSTQAWKSHLDFSRQLNRLQKNLFSNYITSSELNDWYFL